MTSATKASYALASRYAVALIELAQDSGNIDKVESNLNELANMIRDSSDLNLLVRSPSLSGKAQAKAIAAVAERAGFEKLTKNFLGLLVQNRRLNSLMIVMNAFREELSKIRGEITVQVETAQDMTPAQLKSLQESLSRGMGREVSIRAKVEPAIMGGMIVTVGSKMIDDSVRRKLERLKNAMGRQANQNLTSKSQSA